MHTPLLEFLRKSGIRNLYLLHMERKPKTGVYSLTEPIMPPEAPVSTYFPKAAKLKEDRDFYPRMRAD